MKKNKKFNLMISCITTLFLCFLIYACGSNNNTFKVSGKSKIDNRNGYIIVGDSNKIDVKVTKIINNLDVKNQNQIINNIHYYKDTINQIKHFKDSISKKIRALERSYNTAPKREKKKILKQQKQQNQALNVASKREKVFKKVKKELEKLLKENSDKTKIEKPKKIAYAKTALEFLNAIESNTKIILTESEYDISPGEILQNGDTFYGRIKSISNLEIIGQNNEPVHIFSNSINDPVLYFSRVNDLTLKNLKIGHSGILNKDYVGCGPDGDVLEFTDCNDILIESSFLYGCGTQGIDFWGGKRLTVKNSEIYDCTNGIISLKEVFDVLFENCTFKDNQIASRSFFNIDKTKNIKILNSKIQNNTINTDLELLSDENNTPIRKYLFSTQSGDIQNYITVNGRFARAKPTKVKTVLEIINTSIKGNEVDYLANEESNIILKTITYGSPNNKFRKEALYPSNN